jgi:hypothetical protein
MRLSILLLLLSAACQGQSLLKKPVSLTRQTGTVEQFLNDLNTIHGIAISYSTVVVNLSKQVRLSGQERTVEDILTTICKNQPVKFVEHDGKIFLVTTLRSKRRATISGYILDKKSGERLIGASVYVQNKKNGTTSNIYGFFSITPEQDTLLVQISYTGYTSWSSWLILQSDTLLNVSLEQNISLNQMVVINAEAKKNSQYRTINGKSDISSTFIKSIPAVMGEPDVLKSLQLLPGIQAGNEGTSGLNVRGGSADQNLILLDGVPVYNSSHAFGLFSIFNADAVNNVEVLKSGFPPGYGGRLSSVIDVHMREGDKYQLHGEGGLGLVFSKLLLEGPLKKGKSSFLVSVRRTYADLLLGPIVNDRDTKIFPFFSDLNVKFNVPAGKKDRLYFSFYTGQDKLKSFEKSAHEYNGDNFKNKYSFGFSWGNITAMVRWNHVFNKKTFANFTFTHSRYRFNIEENSEDYTNDVLEYKLDKKYNSGIRDWGFKMDVDFLPVPAHFIKCGVMATLHRYRPGMSYFFAQDVNTSSSEQIEKHSSKGGEFDVYLEDDIRISEKMKTNIGTRLSAFAVTGKTFSALQPRINWLYQLNSAWSLKASYGTMNQFIHLLTNSNIGLPTDLWLPVTKNIPPQISRQAAADASYSYDNTMVMSMEVYYKTLKNVIDYTEGSVFYNAYENWENMVETGTGKSYGAEWLFRKTKGKLTGLVSYTLSRSLRQFASINEGKPFPFKYDRRHEVKAAIVWRPSGKLECSANWLFSTGNAISIPTDYYFNPYTNQYIDIYSSRNNYRMRPTHRMDMSVKFIKQKEKYIRTWLISVYNAYNRLNPFFVYKGYEDGDFSKAVYKEVSGFPILPSVSYQFKF